jgi:integrase
VSKKNANGEGSIYRANGQWVGAVSLGYRGGGKRQRKVVRGKTKEEVAKRVRKLLAARDEGQVIPTGSQTVGQFITVWLNDVVRSGNGPRTYRTYEAIARNHVIPALGLIQLSKLTPQQVQAFITKKLDDGMSPRSVESYRTLLVTALGQAEEWDLVPRNVAKRTKRPSVPKKKQNPFTEDEARQFLEAVRDEPLGAILVIAQLEGLRRAECLGLKWKDVDLAKRQIQVVGSLYREDGEDRLIPVKNDKRRKLEITQITKEALVQRKTFQLEERLAGGEAWSNQMGLVFTQAKNGAPLEASKPNRVMNAVLEKAGMRHFNPHGLRHTTATLMMAAGENPKVVAEKLGHSTVAFTLDTYSHVAPSLQASASNRMDQRMGWKR